MPDPDQSAITDCAVAWQSLRVAHDRVAQRVGAELSRECSLASNEFDVLLYLHTHAPAPVRIGALVEAVDLSQPALSRLVARLETRGLLARSGSEGDGRAIVVRLTETGAALVERAMVVHARVVHETLTSRFSDAERAALLRTLSRIGQ